MMLFSAGLRGLVALSILDAVPLVDDDVGPADALEPRELPQHDLVARHEHVVALRVPALLRGFALLRATAELHLPP